MSLCAGKALFSAANRSHLLEVGSAIRTFRTLIRGLVADDKGPHFGSVLFQARFRFVFGDRRCVVALHSVKVLHRCYQLIMTTQRLGFNILLAMAWRCAVPVI